MTKEGISILGPEGMVSDTIPLSEHDVSQLDDTQEIEIGEADTLF